VGVAELTHAEVRGRLSEFIDGSVPDAERRRIEGHLAGCRSCAARHATLKATVHATQQLRPSLAPAGSRAKILDRVRHMKDFENGT
jgi:anti-sigma factor RsiW